MEKKTALALVQKFGSLEGVYENLDDKAIKPKQREKLAANRDKAELSHMLGTIRRDAPIESDPEAYRRGPRRPRQRPPRCSPRLRCTSWPHAGGLDESAPGARRDRRPAARSDPPPKRPPAWHGRVYLAQAPGATKGESGPWYAVQGQMVCEMSPRPPWRRCWTVKPKYGRLTQSRFTTLRSTPAASGRRSGLTASSRLIF